jgi:undecaprenyl-diphosphatase
MQSLAYASGVTLIIKVVLGRHRPRDTDSPYRFNPFSSNHSFPSGHTTAMFSMLVPWAVYYPHPITWGLVAVGGSGTALARILLNKHWFTDVLGGGAIGVVTGMLLARRHLRLSSSADKAHRIRVMPWVSTEQVGLSMIVQSTR